MNDIELLQVLASAADEISLARFRALDLVVEAKPDRTPVTDADKAVEGKLRELLKLYRPTDEVIGEEMDKTGDSNRSWIIDPIDGTANYLRGVPIWGTLIALRVDGEITTSIISAPALGRRWWAGKGRGAFTKDIDGSVRKIAVSKIAMLEDSTLSFNSLEQWRNQGLLEQLLELSTNVSRTRAYGDFLSYMFVAEGAIEIASEHDLKIHDIAALVPILTEAGGRITDLQRELTEDSSSVIATNSLLHQAVQDALK
ncbi:MAG: histidinol phosphatase [Micrococcales bacterium]|nr:histidinol phosphatase [Micrococcales bacterium]MBT5431600.1 histidinol phosphatase [Micrococcales bacterium]